MLDCISIADDLPLLPFNDDRRHRSTWNDDASVCDDPFGSIPPMPTCGCILGRSLQFFAVHRCTVFIIQIYNIIKTRTSLSSSRFTISYSALITLPLRMSFRRPAQRALLRMRLLVRCSRGRSSSGSNFFENESGGRVVQNKSPFVASVVRR